MTVYDLRKAKQSINQISVAPTSPSYPGTVAQQPNQSLAAKSMKQLHNIYGPSGVLSYGCFLKVPYDQRYLLKLCWISNCVYLFMLWEIFMFLTFSSILAHQIKMSHGSRYLLEFSCNFEETFELVQFWKLHIFFCTSALNLANQSEIVIWSLSFGRRTCFRWCHSFDEVNLTWPMVHYTFGICGDFIKKT